MSSIRQLKKDIDNQIFEVISDCFLYTSMHPDGKTDEISSIIEDAVTLRNDLIERINNHGKIDDPKAHRKHFQSISSDLDSGVNGLFNSLSAISKKKKK